MGSVLSQLSSQCGDRTEQSNVKVAFLCLAEPALLGEIRGGLTSENDLLAGDCAEVMTKVAEEQPGTVVPFADDLLAGLGRKKARIRWECMHALALIAGRIPGKITPVLRLVDRLIHTDKSVVVRHYGVQTLVNYASTSRHAAMNAYDFLGRAAGAHQGKFMHLALEGLVHVVKFTDDYDEDIGRMALGLVNHKRAGVRKAAGRLIREIDEKRPDPDGFQSRKD
ncbi:hypothetical protein JW948_15500 [bacterium]|nr:hypothetical protein [bacterium]